ncbi:GNAT family N-acetyltransferase [Denitromonas iodatirespirans]|uniref:GNAT family N-acetyltransferase n=1 Tax=Denitromonas iodatirespirans TaxID=2795389 RepID=A0A944D858_DENI1|nr:GNAT family N-acetyltransferase [Denitromonas iodatirespirans]MBT0961595.1 GNAT family N-acetyltransferase [Denitromonas iodatirespirans]
MTTPGTDLKIEYRRMAEADLPATHALSQAVRWPHRLEDWQFVHRLGTGFVAESEGAIVGTASCWAYGSEHGSLGMVVVSPDAQGKGIGRELMNRVLGELGERSTMLIATLAGQPLYESLGFVATGQIHQHQGTMFQVGTAVPPAGERIRPVGASDAPKLARLASRGLGMPRATVLDALRKVGDCVVLDSGGEPVGFAFCRRFGRGYAIGPVVAPDPERAKALIAHWIGVRAGSFVRIDVHDASGLSPWLVEMGLDRVDSGIIMVRGEPPHVDEGVQQFAIINQALC